MAASVGVGGSGAAGVGDQMCGAGLRCAAATAASLRLAGSGVATGTSVRPGEAARWAWRSDDAPLRWRWVLRGEDAPLLRRWLLRSPSLRVVRFAASVCERWRCWVDRVDLRFVCPLSRSRVLVWLRLRVLALERPRLGVRAGRSSPGSSSLRAPSILA